MRIAIFAETFLPKWDGISNTLCYLLDHLAATGHDSLMIAPKGAPATYANTKIVGLPCFAFPLYPDLHLVPPLFNVSAELTSFKPDLIHIVNPAFLGLVGLRHARELDLPVVASYHTDFPGYTERYGMPYMRETVWAYFRWIHNQADLNLCPSQYTKDELVAHRFQRVRIWGRGVDTQRFNPLHRNLAWRNRLSDNCPDAPLLLFVSRLAQEKRIDWLRPLLNALPGVRLAIVGDGPQRAELEALFAGTPTVFTGYLKGEDLSHAYAAGDLFVFPSASETFGNVVTEAMASGLPVVSARAGGPVDHVRDWQTGFLFDPESVEDMIAKVRQVLYTPCLMSELSTHARAYAESQTWDAIFDGLLQDYERASRIHKSSRRHQVNVWLKSKLQPGNIPHMRV